jgi:formate hydrogenlyase subunit 4
MDSIAKILVWIALAPLVPGVINKVKAWVAGRRGPPLLQLYYDLHKLWRKGVVAGDLASPAFLLAPAVAWTAVLAAAVLIPLGKGGGAVPGFTGDAILALYLLALARFCTGWAAMETGSAFEAMGVAREVSYAVLSEAALVAALVSLAVQSGTFSLTSMLVPSPGAAPALLAAGLFIVLLAENCRVPFDDPATHLELTMVHEVMVLDHSGPPLAAILHGAAMKLLLFAVLLVSIIIPMESLPPAGAAAALAGGVVAVAAGVGLAESLMARLAFRRVPLLLTTAFLLCVFAFLVAWRGAGA